MNYALILAGGSGIRMESEIPKQFIQVNGKPILAYTMDRFEKHPGIDTMVVVSISGWEDFIWRMCKELGYRKLSKVVTGGDSALSSIQNGIDALQCHDDDIIVIHDGVRPLVDADSITAVIEDCSQYGCAISSVPLIEHIAYVGKSRTDVHYIPRENAFRTITPQAYRFSVIQDAYRKAREKGLNSAFIGTLLMDLGEPVCLSKGSEKNIKITNPKDLVFFSTMLDKLCGC